MLKILIVEDELITATDLKETLEKYNFKAVGIASSYREAINW
jgi:YesN/AraC family two-component response regulator